MTRFVQKQEAIPISVRFQAPLNSVLLTKSQNWQSVVSISFSLDVFFGFVSHFLFSISTGFVLQACELSLCVKLK